jgi:hypothetical protein
MKPVKYYRVETTKMNYRETWRMVKPPLSVLAVVMRALQISVPVRVAYPAPAWFSNLRVEPDSLSAACRKVIDAALPDWEREGFHSAQFCRMPALGADATDNGGVFLLHPSGRMAAATLFAGAANGLSTTSSTVGTFLSNGHSISTTNNGGHFDAPIGSETTLVRNASISQLVSAHTGRHASLSENEIFFVRDYAAFETAFNRREELQAEFLIQRGIYRELSPRALQGLAAGDCKFQP